MMRTVLAISFGLLFLAVTALPAAALDISIAYLERQVERPPTLSNLDTVPETLGLDGARLAIDENATTGTFLGHTYILNPFIAAPGDDFLALAAQVLETHDLVVINASAVDVLAVADLPGAAQALLFNVAAADSGLRSADCRANVLHTLPSRAMLADALMQFLLKKRWTKVALVAGTQPGDVAYADAMNASAKKYGIKIGKQKTWTFDADMRRTAAQEVPGFTQGLGKHDVLLIADELGDFGRYIQYNTWAARPLAGSEGLMPTAWSPVVEQWGAVQLQNRFAGLAGRGMRPVDYAAWAAIRVIGEAVTRTSSADVADLRAHLLSDKFAMAAFKGRKLGFRNWSGQLRQTIPLVSSRAVVALAPLEGFLHQFSELDTIGLDRPESKCSKFPEAK